MKVLQINAVYAKLSTGRLAMEMHEFLKENGIQSFVACSSIVGLSDEVYVIGNRLDYKIHGLLSRLFGLQGYFSVSSTKKLLKYIDGIQPDVVQLHNLHGNYINLPMLLNYLADKKIAVVIVLHDCWFFTGKCVHYTLAGCDKWKTECGSCPSLKKGNVSWFFDRSKKMQRDKKHLFCQIDRLGVVGVSDWITDDARQSILKNATIIKRIYNWIDINDFKPMPATDLRKKLNLVEDFIILGVAAGWSNAKGLDKFLKLSGLLQANQKIVLVGNMSDNIILPDNVLCVGSTDSVAQLAEFYSMADVFVTMSLEETFGKVSAEALACGTPVVCFRSTANPELVGEGCGYVVEKDDMQGMLSAIQTIYKNGKSEYSSLCVEFAEKNFLKNERMGDFLELYKRLLEK